MAILYAFSSLTVSLLFVRTTAPATHGPDQSRVHQNASEKRRLANQTSDKLLSRVFRQSIIGPGKWHRIQIVCPQNTACTAWVLWLCGVFSHILFEPVACVPDTAYCNKSCESQLIPYPSGEHHTIAKVTFSGPEYCTPFDHFVKFDATVKIAFFRSLVQTNLSLSKQWWRENCGGIASKVGSADQWLQEHYSTGVGRLEKENVNGVLFAEDFRFKFEAAMSTLVQMGIFTLSQIKHIAEVKPPMRMFPIKTWTWRNEQLGYTGVPLYGNGRSWGKATMYKVHARDVSQKSEHWRTHLAHSAPFWYNLYEGSYG